MMKNTLFALALQLTIGAAAQTPSSLPQTLPELARALPAQIHSKQFQFGPFSDAAWAALQKDPASAYATIPILGRNLQDPDQEVQFYSITLLQALALRPDSPELLSPVSPQLARAITTGNQYTQSIALVTVANLGKRAPNELIPPIQSLLLSRATPEKVLLASASALMLARPTDEAVQNNVLAVINDSSRSQQFRQQFLFAAAEPGVGTPIVDTVVKTVYTSEDKQVRDNAIAAADRIGPDALLRIGYQLNKIASDPSESLSSHKLVTRALRVNSAP